MRSLSKHLAGALCVALLSVSIHGAAADASRDRRPDERRRLDQRHDYPPRGHVVQVLPRDAYASRWRRSTYYFHGGVWYRPERTHWVVVAPPIGLVVPSLPPFYTTVWFGGVPYYFVNDVYYLWRPEQRAYVVTEAPASDSALDAGTAPEELFVYPKNGQTADQQATDRYECHRWAAAETGFDPTSSLGGVSADQAVAKRAAYLRAMTACLEGRGYSVK